MSYIIRPVQEDDAQATLDLLHPIIMNGSYTIMQETLSIEAQAEYIRSFRHCGICNVAVQEQDGTIIGMQSIEPIHGDAKAFRHVGEVSTFVALGAHRQGIGRSLSTVTFQESFKQGFLKLMAMIRADNPQAVSFYRGLGFTFIGTAKSHALVNNAFIDEVLAELLLNT